MPWLIYKTEVITAQTYSYPDQEADALRLLGKIYLTQQKPDAALSSLLNALALATKINHKQRLYECHQLLYQAYKLKGNFAEALTHHEQFFAIKEAVFNEESNQKLQNLEVLYRTETAQKEANYYASLYEIEQTRRHLAEILNQVGRALTGTLNLNEILNKILAQLAELVQYDRGGLLLRRQEMMEFVAAYGYDTDNALLQYTVPIHLEDESDIFVHIYRHKRPLAIANVPEYERWTKVGDIPVPGSWLGIPLLQNEEVVGMLSLARQEVSPYNEEEITLATAFANQATIALENARLYGRVQRFNEQLEVEGP